MALVEIASQVNGWVADEAGNALAGRTVVFTSGTVYTSSAGTTPLTPVTTDSRGYVQGWIAEGEYTYTAAGKTFTLHAFKAGSTGRLGAVESGAVRVWADAAVAVLTGLDQTAAIQALIDSADAKAFIDFGDTRHSYNVSSLTPKGGQTYHARGATLNHKAGSTNGIFYWPQSPRTLLEGCTWIGLKFQGEVNDAAFEANRSGIFVTYGHRLLVMDCEFYDFRSSAVHMADCGDVTYLNLLAKRCSNGEELEFNGGAVGRNALEVIGSALTGNETANYEWTVRNCKVYMNGASKGGAGGIVTNMRNAPYVRATIDGNWIYDSLNFCGIGVETWGRYCSVTDNKIFGCIAGILALDTTGGSFGATQINDRVQISGNTIDCKCITPGGSSRPASSLLGALTVAYEADVPLANGIWGHPSHGVITDNIIRATGDGIRCLGTAARHIVGTVIDDNTVTICNTDAANRPFGMTLQLMDDVTVGAGNFVEGEAGATFKDAYFLSDINGGRFLGGSRRAGRNAVRLNANVIYASFDGQHLDPAANEATAAISIQATSCRDLNFNGRLHDTRGVPTMTTGLDFSTGALTRVTTGDLVILGWTSSAVGSATNANVDQSRLVTEDHPLKTRGQNTNRRGRIAAQPASGTNSSGDRFESTSSQPGTPVGWGCSASGTPGTWRPLGIIPGTQTLATDAVFTLTPQTDVEQTFHTGTLTANRAVTLSTTGAFAGARFRITRTGGGAFTLDVGTGPLKSLATNTWGEFVYDGSAWKLSAYGAL